ncbi:hypothetical protein [Raoultibacter timonensis]|uniref:Uncharacterized protein n=1 Tax=Raoultibacter timonensis TaxID=1907662 RepID=A0ABN6MCW1_9ACTN|nr:hypothetical protein [Raoultibacter timonensis]BDE94880.1 hypothetical protein CE91St30_02130 [Raoultibacter timonensis]BDF49483.1 hypothetical protein CE91St31_02130 [Raoultibacter timonensis]
MGKDSTVEAGTFEKRLAAGFLTNLLFPRRLERGLLNEVQIEVHGRIERFAFDIVRCAAS